MSAFACAWYPSRRTVQDLTGRMAARAPHPPMCWHHAGDAGHPEAIGYPFGQTFWVNPTEIPLSALTLAAPHGASARWNDAGTADGGPAIVRDPLRESASSSPESTAGPEEPSSASFPWGDLNGGVLRLWRRNWALTTIFLSNNYHPSYS